MIEKKYIQQWKAHAPWPLESQVEQDLIISRALCELFSEKKIQEALAFRGGTALQKIFLKTPSRYSEDIDLVQIPKEPIGEVIDLVRQKLDPWLGKPQVDRKVGRLTMRYKYLTTEEPSIPMKLKIEINNAEHFSVFGHKQKDFSMQSEWFSSKCQITTFSIEEILGTKLRALYQRKKGRDLFDFACAFAEFPNLDDKKIVECFLKYMAYGKHKVSRAEFEIALDEKRKDSEFTTDIEPLLPDSIQGFNAAIAFKDVETRLITLLPGGAWKKSVSTKRS